MVVVHIRKGINFGPIRLNLSRSGLGASFGVKGARVGIGPKGRYIHVGRHGLYYRKQLNDGERPHDHPLQPEPEPIRPDHLEEIESADISQLADESSKDLLDELNRVQKRTEWFPIVLIISICVLLYLMGIGASGWLILLYLIVAIAGILYVRHTDVMKTTAILNYDLEDDVQKNFAGLITRFKSLMECNGKWHIQAAGDTDDWKRSAGASRVVRRNKTKLSLAKPKKIVSNIDVPTFDAGKQTLYFFPDRVLIFEKKGVGAVDYDSLEIECATTRFIEEETVASDAEIVDSTWKYVNKKGGPDRRFRDNRELPIVLYGQLHFRSSTGLNEQFQFSVPGACEKFEAEFQDYKSYK